MRRASLSVPLGQGSVSLAYGEWGRADHPKILVCVHGLTRNSRDFDEIAAVLSADYRVICIDLPGRGDSGWLDNKADYALPSYIQACSGLLAHLGAHQIDWLGTSLGGLIGMSLAAMPGNPIRRLVLNDIGPFLPAQALRRIALSVGTDPRFDSLAEAEAFLRLSLVSFGIRRDAHWRQMAEASTRPDGQGRLRLHYDPGIAQVFAAAADQLQDAVLWPLWAMIQCPTLVLRGAESDLLSAETARQMTQCGPQAELLEFLGCGHAPALMEPDQIAPVRDWLLRP